MSEEMLIRYCSPTLAGMKTASLFNCKFASYEKLKSAIRAFNRRLGAKGIRIIPLKIGKSSALIYVYRPARLKKDFSDKLCLELLQNSGYVCDCPEKCIARLSSRIKSSEDFPHEIGLFLGYPPEDVRGFIRYGSHRCLCTGCWKVYSDVPSALKTFAKFNKCTQKYAECYALGRNLEKLAVVT